MTIQTTVELHNKHEQSSKGIDIHDEEERLTLAVGESDRTRALLDGTVQIKGIKLSARNERLGEFCTRPVYEMYDAAEMSLSWYVMAHCRGEPLVALPIFPLRMWVQAFLFCRSEDPYVRPSNLRGKRIGVHQYRLTVNLWVRGILQDHYGVRPEEFLWITTEDEGAGFSLPPGVAVTVRPGEDLEEMLVNREIDALLLPKPAKLFQTGDPRIRRLFPDCLGEIRKYFCDSKIFPITHTVVMRKALWTKKPWTAPSLVEAFKTAQAECSRFNSDPRRLSIVEAPFVLEHERATFGPDPWIQGIEPNRHVLETFIRYAHDQGYIKYQPKLERLFAENTLSL
jgi:4,5-dihydroxyphthalate decarboxylase